MIDNVMGFVHGNENSSGNPVEMGVAFGLLMGMEMGMMT